MGGPERRQTKEDGKIEKEVEEEFQGCVRAPCKVGYFCAGSWLVVGGYLRSGRVENGKTEGGGGRPLDGGRPANTLGG